MDECGGERRSGFTVLPAGGGGVKYFKKCFRKFHNDCFLFLSLS